MNKQKVFALLFFNNFCIFVKYSINIGTELNLIFDFKNAGNFQIQSHPKKTFSYPETKLYGTDVVIKVVKDDITSHEADAIVNASNEELELRMAGISGSIMRKGIK